MPHGHVNGNNSGQVKPRELGVGDNNEGIDSGQVKPRELGVGDNNEGILSKVQSRLARTARTLMVLSFYR